MRGLAEFVMRGRWQALAVAMVGSGSLLFGWISAAAVALVTLRQGATSGGWLVFWALLPASVLAWMSGDAGGLLLLAGVYCMAVLLRESVSLPLALMATLPVGVLSGVFLLTATEGFLEQLVDWFDQFITELNRSLNSQGGSVALTSPTVAQVAGMLAAGNAALCTVSLLLGRYWQAALYNPGGFGEEFRQLRLPPSVTLVLTGLVVALWFAGSDLAGWALIAAVPLTFCGFALVHARVQIKGRGITWLTMFYLFWVVFDPAKALLVGLVAVDALVDFRRRWSQPRS